MSLVVFAGQSNALGFGMDASTLPANYWRGDPRTFIWNNETGGFEVMTPGVNTGTLKNPGAWGPEVAFAATFRQDHPDEALFIVKSAKGSTGLAADPNRLDWSPQSEGEMFDLTTQRVADARAALGGMEVDGVFFVQGEQDAFDEDAAQAYGDNLQAWIAAVRDEWIADEDGKVAFARINDSTPWFETVRWAQYVTDAEDPFAASFDTYDDMMQADGLHYAAEGHLAIGGQFYSLYDGWV